jgi:hypothetical protein
VGYGTFDVSNFDEISETQGTGKREGQAAHQLTDDAALRTIMVSMREAVERRLTEPVRRREAG